MVECYCCGRREDSDLAAETGWLPEFRRGEEVIDEPACPGCVKTRMREDGQGGHVIIEVEHDEAAVAVVWGRYFDFPMYARGLDGLDFHDVGVDRLRAALVTAYRTGRGAARSGAGTPGTCDEAG